MNGEGKTMSKAPNKTHASMTITKRKDGSVTFTARSRKAGVDLRNFVFSLSGEQPPADDDDVRDED